MSIDPREVERLARDIVGDVLKAQTQSVQAATRRLEQEIEGLTRAAVPGKAWRAWTSAVYPSRPIAAYEPVGEVFGKGGRRTQGMLSFWSLPGTNRAKHGEYLAVPLDAARGSWSGRHISPREWEGRFGAKLRPLFRPGKTPLLVADGAMGPTGFLPEDRAAAKRRGGQKVGERRTVAVFALIATQEHANTVSLGPVIARAGDYMVQDFARRMDRLGR